MIRFQQPPLAPTADHSQWQNSWNDDERRLAYAIGYVGDLIDISLCKRVLQDDLTPALRLRFLEIIHKLVHGDLAVEAMQAVQPCCDTAMKMLDEMKALEPADKLRLTTSWNVCAAFINLNPSLIQAIKMFSGQHQRTA